MPQLLNMAGLGLLPGKHVEVLVFSGGVRFLIEFARISMKF